MSNAVFSDSWFRIANTRVSLLSTARVNEHVFRGKTWYVVQDTYSHRFFRITPQAWRFISALTPQRTVEEVWRDFIERHPEEAPGQDEIVRVLSQLHMSNLLYTADAPDNASVYKRSKQQRQREFRGKLMSFLYVRVYLWNPDRWLDRMLSLIRLMTGPLAGVLWLLAVLAGAGTAVSHWDALFDKGQGLFSVSNLPWLFLSLSAMKLLHETAHAFVCKRFGGKVHAFGIMFLILTPLPYVDMSSTWAFKNRFKRALVGAAGMMCELFVAALATLVWVRTGPGLVNSLAFNLMVVGSVSALAFNGNPLMRFDAYYILADLVDIPNLYQKAQQQWLYFGDRYVLGTRQAESPAADEREWWWFTVYGLLAFIYRLPVAFGIVLVVLDQWFVVGLVMGCITLATMFGMPARKLIAHLRSPKVQRNRRRAVVTVSVVAATVLGVGQFVPFPYSIRASGVLQASQSTIIHPVAEGALVKAYARNGDMVKRGSILAVLENPDLDYEVELVRQQQREVEMQTRQSVFRQIADIAPLNERRAALARQMQELDRLRAQLTIRAPHDGEWVAPGLQERDGSWIGRGQSLGEVVKGDHFRFVAVVQQEQADELFRHSFDGAQLRLNGQADVRVPVAGLTLIPFQRERLTSSALGIMGGGEIAVRPTDQSGQAAAESFYELHAAVGAHTPPGLTPLHGLSGVLRIPLPSEPLFWQARKALMQLFQRRYAI
jgi:putative peptide zinc metalloprotease protein